MDEKSFNKVLEISEQFYGTANDPEQIPINQESRDKLQKLHSKALIFTIENSEPVSWTVIVPTSNKLAEKFLKGEISERDLLDMTEPAKQYEALYLCSAFTVPEYRKKGYAIKLLKEQINSIPHTANPLLFAWIYSQEGERLVDKLEQELGVKIHRR
jgi:hypothetical protein